MKAVFESVPLRLERPSVKEIELVRYISMPENSVVTNVSLSSHRGSKFVNSRYLHKGVVHWDLVIGNGRAYLRCTRDADAEDNNDNNNGPVPGEFRIS